MDMCDRLGCQKAGTSQCSRCKKTRYCGTVCQKEDWIWHKKTCRAPPNNESEWVGMRVDLSSDRSKDVVCAVQWHCDDSAETLARIAQSHMPKKAAVVAARHSILTFHNAEQTDKGKILFRDGVGIDLIVALMHKTREKGDWEKAVRALHAQGQTICCATFVWFLTGEELPHVTRQICFVLTEDGEPVVL